LNIVEASAKVLALAANGVSYTRIVGIHQRPEQDEIKWLLNMLVDKRLLEVDSSSRYWTTAEGTKVLEIQFHLERILQVQKSLV
jgi:hypothetical protein